MKVFNLTTFYPRSSEYRPIRPKIALLQTNSLLPLSTVVPKVDWNVPNSVLILVYTKKRRHNCVQIRKKSFIKKCLLRYWLTIAENPAWHRFRPIFLGPANIDLRSCDLHLIRYQQIIIVILQSLNFGKRCLNMLQSYQYWIYDIDP